MKWDGSIEQNSRCIHLKGIAIQIEVTRTGGNRYSMEWRVRQNDRVIFNRPCNDFADGEEKAERWLKWFWLEIGKKLEE